MKSGWEDINEFFAAGANCPMPDCGEVNFTYHIENENPEGIPGLWEFTCSRCGIQFTTVEEDLLFHSVRRDWLWAGSHSA
jgi:hypothetical protein